MTTASGADMLRKFLDEHGVTQAQAAASLGVSAPTVHDWLTEAKRPRAQHREAIAAWTGGRVPAACWLTPEETAAIAGVTPFAPSDDGDAPAPTGTDG